MVSGFVAVQGKEIAGKIVVAKVRNSQRMNDPLLNQKVSRVATIQWENILETVNSETTNWYTRSYNGAFSLSFIGTEHEHELLIHKLLIC